GQLCPRSGSTAAPVANPVSQPTGPSWVAAISPRNRRISDEKSHFDAGTSYRRELPYIVAALAALTASPRIIVVDVYVWLAPGRHGLGARVHAALGGIAASRS